MILANFIKSHACDERQTSHDKRKSQTQFVQWYMIMQQICQPFIPAKCRDAYETSMKIEKTQTNKVKCITLRHNFTLINSIYLILLLNLL